MRYEYAYDCMNRLVRKTASGKMLLENRYDLNGNRIGRKDISGKETVYEYDHLDRMSKVVDNGHESVIYQYYEMTKIYYHILYEHYAFSAGVLRKIVREIENMLLAPQDEPIKVEDSEEKNK